MTSSDGLEDKAGGQGKPRRRRSVVTYAPIAIFAILAIVFAFQLINNDGSDLPSTMIGRAAPEFDMPALEGLTNANGPVPGFSNEDLSGQITVVNVFASWCGPCRQEHPFIEELGEDDRFALYGINHTDQTVNALAFLSDFGNPYDAVGIDPRQRVSIDWGVYGVPETFVVDQDGVVREKFIGPISAERLENEVMPAIEELLAAVPEA